MARPEVVDLSRMYQLAEASPTAPVPPQNLDAEESVLGAMMLSPGAIGAVSEVLTASDFYRASHGSIYKAALDLYAKGEPVDAITVVDELERRGELEEVGGRVRINELAALVPDDVQRGSLRQDRPGDGHAPRPRSSRAGDRRARDGPPGARGRRSSSTRPSPSSSTSRRSASPASSPTSRICSRTASSGSPRSTRRARMSPAWPAATRSSTASPPASSRGTSSFAPPVRRWASRPSVSVWPRRPSRRC